MLMRMLKTFMLFLVLLLSISMNTTDTALAQAPVTLRSYADAYYMMQKYDAPGIFVFHSRSCKPCGQMQTDTWSPLMPGLKKNYVVYFIDVDVEPQVTAQWKVTNFPAYIMVSEGAKKTIAMGTGYRSKPEFLLWARSGIKKWRAKQPKK